MRKIHYTLYREDSDFVVQCLDYDISTFGSTEVEALEKLKGQILANYPGGRVKPGSIADGI